MDSAWTPERAKFNVKAGNRPGPLNDGTAFEIYERYCDRDDIARQARQHRATVRTEHFGTAFLATIARR